MSELTADILEFSFWEPQTKPWFCDPPERPPDYASWLFFLILSTYALVPLVFYTWITNDVYTFLQYTANEVAARVTDILKLRERMSTTTTAPTTAATTTTTAAATTSAAPAAAAISTTPTPRPDDIEVSPSRSGLAANNPRYLQRIALQLVQKVDAQRRLHDPAGNMANLPDEAVFAADNALDEISSFITTANGSEPVTLYYGPGESRPVVARGDAQIRFSKPIKNEDRTSDLIADVPFTVVAGDGTYSVPGFRLPMAAFLHLTFRMRNALHEAPLQWLEPAAPAAQQTASPQQDPAIARYLEQQQETKRLSHETQRRGNRPQQQRVIQDLQAKNLYCMYDMHRRMTLATEVNNADYTTEQLLLRLCSAPAVKAGDNIKSGSATRPVFSDGAGQEASVMAQLLGLLTENKVDQAIVLLKLRIFELLDAAEGKPEPKRNGEHARALASMFAVPTSASMRLKSSLTTRCRRKRPRNFRRRRTASHAKARADFPQLNLSNAPCRGTGPRNERLMRNRLRTAQRTRRAPRRPRRRVLLTAVPRARPSQYQHLRARRAHSTPASAVGQGRSPTAFTALRSR